MIALVSRERFAALLRKEKDGASPPICFRRDSLNAFIPRFAGVWRFFIFKILPASRWSSKLKLFSEIYSANKLKDQHQ